MDVTDLFNKVVSDIKHIEFTFASNKALVLSSFEDVERMFSDVFFNKT